VFTRKPETLDRRCSKNWRETTDSDQSQIPGALSARAGLSLAFPADLPRTDPHQGVSSSGRRNSRIHLEFAIENGKVTALKGAIPRRITFPRQ